MKNRSLRALGLPGVLVIVVIIGLAAAIIGPQFSPAKKMSRDEALTIPTITGPEKVAPGDIIKIDTNMFRIQLGFEKEDGFIFLEYVSPQGEHGELAKSLLEFNGTAKWWNDYNFHPRLIKVGTPKYEKMVGVFPNRQQLH